MAGRRLRFDLPHRSFERSLDDFERLLSAAKESVATDPASSAILDAFDENPALDSLGSKAVHLSDDWRLTAEPLLNELINAELAQLDCIRRREELERLMSK
jgi:hypothetical protein